MSQTRKYVILAAVVASALAALSAADARGLRRCHKLEAEVRTYQEKHQSLITENMSLRREIESLSGNLKAMERAAREDLGLVRSNEVVFTFETGR